MHAGSVVTSRRLRATLRVLVFHAGHLVTTAMIQRATGSQAVHSDIAALRMPPNNYRIPRAAMLYRRADGTKVMAYRIEKRDMDKARRLLAAKEAR